jgi:hypothetical protein
MTYFFLTYLKTKLVVRPHFIVSFCITLTDFLWHCLTIRTFLCYYLLDFILLVMWGGKFSAIFFPKIFRFLKSSLNISFFNLFLVALGLGGFESCMCSYLTVAVSVAVTTSQAQGHKKEVEERNIKWWFWETENFLEKYCGKFSVGENFLWKIFHLTSLAVATVGFHWRFKGLRAARDIRGFGKVRNIL